MSSATAIVDLLRAHIIPSLRRPSFKGAHGKLLVVGGCEMYTGAPFFAASTALKCGVDIATIACTASAAAAIKSYSPDLIVAAVLPSSASASAGAPSEPAVAAGVAAVGALMERCDALVIGPGLGRDPQTLDCAAGILLLATARGLPTVVDGDALWLLAQSASLRCALMGHPACVLTPNAVEFKRLMEATAGGGGGAGGARSATGGGGGGGGGGATAGGGGGGGGATAGGGGGATGGLCALASASASSSAGSAAGAGAGALGPHDHSAEAAELSRRLGGGLCVLRKGTRDEVCVAGGALAGDGLGGQASGGGQSSGGGQPSGGGQASSLAASAASVDEPSSPRRCVVGWGREGAR